MTDILETIVSSRKLVAGGLEGRLPSNCRIEECRVHCEGVSLRVGDIELKYFAPEESQQHFGWVISTGDNRKTSTTDKRFDVLSRAEPPLSLLCGCFFTGLWRLRFDLPETYKADANLVKGGEKPAGFSRYIFFHGTKIVIENQDCYLYMVWAGDGLGWQFDCSPEQGNFRSYDWAAVTTSRLLVPKVFEYDSSR